MIEILDKVEENSVVLVVHYMCLKFTLMEKEWVFEMEILEMVQILLVTNSRVFVNGF